MFRSVVCARLGFAMDCFWDVKREGRVIMEEEMEDGGLRWISVVILLKKRGIWVVGR